MIMNKTIFYSFFAALLLFACRKSDNPKIPELTRVPVPQFVAAANSDQSIDVAGNPATFKANFNVGMLFPEEPAPQKLDVVVRKNGTGAVKVIKSDVSTYPTSIQVTGQQLIDLFGPIKLGDYFDFAADLYLSGGQKIEAFPATGVQFSGGTVNIPTSAPTLRYAAICKYDPAVYQGAFKASDEFGDADGEVITLTKVDNTHFSFVYPSVLNPTPIVVTINPANNNATIAQQTIGSHWDPAYGYPNTATYADASAVATSGSVAPCNKTVTLQVVWGVQKGAAVFKSAGYQLVLTKQ